MKRLVLGIAILPVIFFAQAAHATSSWPFGWWSNDSAWDEYKGYKPYLENPKETQNQQWADEDWRVQDWLDQDQDGEKLVQNFYKVDILREQTEDHGVPVLVVGASFYRLGGFDKRRVITTVDTVYGVTESGQHPAIILRDWFTKRDIGLYTKEGLQLE